MACRITGWERASLQQHWETLALTPPSGTERAKKFCTAARRLSQLVKKEG
jgi:hypothetical protein